jgi:hypothetical protein
LHIKADSAINAGMFSVPREGRGYATAHEPAHSIATNNHDLVITFVILDCRNQMSLKPPARRHLEFNGDLSTTKVHVDFAEDWSDNLLVAQKQMVRLQFWLWVLVVAVAALFWPWGGTVRLPGSPSSSTPTSLPAQ